MSSTIQAYIDALKDSPRLGPQIVHHRILPGAEACYADPARPWPKALAAAVRALGVDRLYAHQTQAMDLAREGSHVVIATPTASGKTLVYNLPVIEAVLANPEARALYLFPLKALAQDQWRAFGELAGLLPAPGPRAALYDGDTKPSDREKVRKTLPNVLMTNPEMVHLSLLAHHGTWAKFFAGLSYVVVDEVHTYRGVMGAHMAQVFRRLLRICRYYGSEPTFIFSSATVGNPAELCAELTGLPVTAVTESGAARARRHVLFLNPEESPSGAAIQLLQAGLEQGLRTIVYTQSRKMTELIALWAAERSGKFKGRISAYRAGFLPAERREIEARMTSGELLAVISTSALELGIDIGGLDLCILVGYPGTIMQTWQRGGRVGRAQRDSVLALVAQEDALDQYFMRNPDDFFSRPPEDAVVNPHNPVILERHLVCAAAELPLRLGPGPELEDFLAAPAVLSLAQDMADRGLLLRSADGWELHAAAKRPHQDVDLRGAGRTMTIEDTTTGKVIGLIDGLRAHTETHPGAVYLHRGKTYLITELDFSTATVRAAPARVGYYTRTRGEKSTEILDIQGQADLGGTRVAFGRLRVTDQVTGYEKRQVRGGALLTLVPLDLPPLIFETEGLWFEIPKPLMRATEEAQLHFMGGIHALEHAAIGILPLLVLADRNDLGGISTPFHPQVDGPAVFIYDGLPGGAGLARQAFRHAGDLLRSTLAVVAGCPCELGCPSCVHSPKCGSGNRPMDKAAARLMLEGMVRGMGEEQDQGRGNPFLGKGVPSPLDPSPSPKTFGYGWGERQAKVAKDGGGEKKAKAEVLLPGIRETVEVFGVVEEMMLPMEMRPGPLRFGVLDIETRRSALEVGGWNRADRMGVSVAVLYDSGKDEFFSYEEERVPELAERLLEFDLVVGFNISRFDYAVLAGVHRFEYRKLPTLDLLTHIYGRLGYRLKLDNIAEATLDAGKTADGLQALAWWKEGRMDLIDEYCRADVAITRDVYLFGRANKHVLFTNKAGQKVKLPVDW